jgi:HAD superfamily hydrolase (TIGR01509 family)
MLDPRADVAPRPGCAQLSSVLRAVLLDVDGTLVDSVDLHARAWQEAFRHFGKEVDLADVRSQIGKGGDQLVPAFLDEDELEAWGDDLQRYRARLFARRYLPWVRPLPGARELLVRVRSAGLRAGLASSCREDELRHHVALVGLQGLFDAAVTADDADRSKPHPDLFDACLDRLAVRPAEALAVGDSPYDAVAAARAGVRTVGLLSGGFPRRALEEAGCVAIYEDPADLTVRFDASPLAGRGGDAHAGG